ncbi:hypothetical protein AA13595_2863 [Gluconacetobacter johannae DSM 13595]|uniref:Uncharacterized protein n=1 Tax=Gluconacetobacter johannae TaxID=112140 RepID=A0A7W4P4Q4_9PROT|nr:hypothetical protein [Gluconacetobacter johannae]MBB2177282.1 hypothetical protein [Gluconacetobacter johannae]GBQ90328.1 hypothetical protein AA13595_2863 [Gluconacetobacter johannae DSM 13595]
MAIRQHKQMAETGRVPDEASDFGIPSLAQVNGGRESPDRARAGAVLDDGARGCAPPLSRGGGRMPASAEPDHGPHRAGRRDGLTR